MKKFILILIFTFLPLYPASQLTVCTDKGAYYLLRGDTEIEVTLIQSDMSKIFTIKSWRQVFADKNINNTTIDTTAYSIGKGVMYTFESKKKETVVKLHDLFTKIGNCIKK